MPRWIRCTSTHYGWGGGIQCQGHVGHKGLHKYKLVRSFIIWNDKDASDSLIDKTLEVLK